MKQDISQKENSLQQKHSEFVEKNNAMHTDKRGGLLTAREAKKQEIDQLKEEHRIKNMLTTTKIRKQDLKKKD